MYKAVILENFSEAREEVQQGLTNEDYDMFYELWQKFDPKGTEFINLNRLSDFVASLEEPLGIPKPNRLKLISMNLPVCENYKVHCLDILDALTKNFLGGGEEIMPAEPVEILKKDRPSNYKPFTTTLQLQRENYCAHVVIKAFRNYIKKKKEMEQNRKPVRKAVIEEDSNISDASPQFERIPIYDTSEVSDMDSEFDRILKNHLKPKRI